MKRIEPGEARIILKNSGISPNNVVGKIRKDLTQSAKTFMGYDLKDEDSQNGLLGVVVTLVSCPRNTRYFVAIKMGRRQGVRREHI
jgi:hypothetical protein